RISQEAVETALEHLQEAHRLWWATGNATWLAQAPVALGWTYLALGQEDEATACFAEAAACLALVADPHAFLPAVCGAALAGLEAAGSAAAVAVLIERLATPAGVAVLPRTLVLQPADRPALRPTHLPAAWTWTDPSGDCSYAADGGGLLL